MQLTVNVTADDIAHGLPGITTSCPIAIALRPVIRDALDLEAFDQFGLRVLCGRVDVTTAGCDWTATMPYEASSFVRRFDEYDDVIPIQFTLDLVPR